MTSAALIVVICCSKPYWHWQITLGDMKRSSGGVYREHAGPSFCPDPLIWVSAKQPCKSGFSIVMDWILRSLLRKIYSQTSGSPSFPRAFGGNPAESLTGPPIKAFGGDDCGTNSYTNLIPRSLLRGIHLLGPDFLPPCLGSGAIGNHGAEIHLRADLSNVPACEVGELLCFSFVSLCQLTPIIFRGRAFIIAGPGVSQHVATLKVGAIGGFLHYEVFREMCGVVTNMHTRNENVSRSRGN